MVKRLLICIMFFFIAAAAMADDSMVYDIYGKPFNEPLTPNKWIVINYWASWCDACVAEIPDLNRFAAMAKSHDIVFFAVNYDDMPEAIQQSFAKQHSMKFTMLRTNPLSHLIPADAITTLPMTYVISPQGETQQLFGMQTTENILRTIH